MSSYYKMEPAKWDFGTADLTLEEEAAYLRIVNAIHKHDAPVPDNDRVLAGMFRTSTRKAKVLVEALIKAGKLTIEDGKIWNEKARSDMVQRVFITNSRVESGAKGGRTRAENAAKALKDNNSGQGNASSRIEYNRIEKEYVQTQQLELVPSPVKEPAEKDRFSEFWAVYPKKEGKGNAERNFARAVKDGADAERIIEGARRYAKVAAGMDRKFIKMPEGWLTAKRWEDADLWAAEPDPQLDRLRAIRQQAQANEARQ